MCSRFLNAPRVVERDRVRVTKEKILTMTSDTSRRPRVVVAEDNSVLRYSLKLILESLYEVVGEAENGRVAVDLVEALRPDAILLDISMPVMNGFEAARLIRESQPKVRIIVVSSYSEAALIEEAFRSGAHGYVVKRSAVSQLLQALEDTLNGKDFRPA